MNTRTLYILNKCYLPLLAHISPVCALPLNIISRRVHMNGMWRSQRAHALVPPVLSSLTLAQPRTFIPTRMILLVLALQRAPSTASGTAQQRSLDEARHKSSPPCPMAHAHASALWTLVTSRTLLPASYPCLGWTKQNATRSSDRAVAWHSRTKMAVRC